MIQVRVKLFATLRERAGWAQKTWELPDAATVATLLDTLGEAEPNLEVAGRPIYAAVNQQYVGRDAALHDGDEVALFPPVSGGQSGA
jgi:molybdopterin converting factor subunit 1